MNEKTPAERLAEVASFLAYLWIATGKDGKTRVCDLFADNDPIIADADRYIALSVLSPVSGEPGLRAALREAEASDAIWRIHQLLRPLFADLADSAAKAERPDMERQRVEQAFIDGSVAGSPLDHDGNRVVSEEPGLQAALEKMPRWFESVNTHDVGGSCLRQHRTGEWVRYDDIAGALAESAAPVLCVSCTKPIDHDPHNPAIHVGCARRDELARRGRVRP